MIVNGVLMDKIMHELISTDGLYVSDSRMTQDTVGWRIDNTDLIKQLDEAQRDSHDHIMEHLFDNAEEDIIEEGTIKDIKVTKHGEEQWESKTLLASLRAWGDMDGKLVDIMTVKTKQGESARILLSALKEIQIYSDMAVFIYKDGVDVLDLCSIDMLQIR